MGTANRKHCSARESVRARRTIGVLGGKGPEATSLLFDLIIKNTPAGKEEDHLRIVIDNNPRIPKPALAITGQGKDPVPALIETAQNLVRARADFIAIPCNSAHYYLEAIRAAVRIPVLSVISETVKVAKVLSCTRLGLLTSTGLLESELYQSALADAGIASVTLNVGDQERLMEAIIHFKDSGNLRYLRSEALAACQWLLAQDIDGLLLGCMELPVVLAGESFPIPVLDTLEILARAAVREAMRKD